jgi:prephenate dehydrogenase
MKAAKDVKAVSKVEANLPSAVVGADLIILCEPLGETLKTLEAVAPDLNNHRYLFDFCPGKQAINQKLSQLAPEYIHHLNLSVTENPKYLWADSSVRSQPQSDFFENGIMYVAAGNHASEEAVDLATTLSGMMKTKIIFGDVAELDGLIASASQLPALLGSVLIHTVGSQPGWREARKLTGTPFYHSVGTIDNPDESAESWIANKENLRYWIQQINNSMEELDALLVLEDPVQLKIWKEKAVHNYLQTMGQRIKGEWDVFEKPDEKPMNLAERLGKLIGFGKKKL